MTDETAEPRKLDFIRQIVADAQQSGQTIVTRFRQSPMATYTLATPKVFY